MREYLHAALVENQLTSVGEIVENWHKIDKNNSGFITYCEFMMMEGPPMYLKQKL